MLDRVNKELGVEVAADKEVKKRIEAIKDLSGKLVEVNKSLDAVNLSLKDAAIDDNGAEGVKILTALRDELKKDRDKLETVVKVAVKELVDARALPADSNNLLDGIKNVRAKAENPIGKSLGFVVNSMSGVGPAMADYLQKSLDSTNLLAELKILKAREDYLITPAEKTDYFLTLLKDRRSKNPQDLLKAEHHAQWLLEDNAKSSAEVKANAHFLLALVHRNRQEFDKAAAAIEEAKKQAVLVKDLDIAKGQALMKKFDESRTDFIDPLVYLRRAGDLEARGQLTAAVAELTVGLKAAPDHQKLLSRRAMLQVEAWRAGNPGKVPSDEVYKAVLADSEKAQAGADLQSKVEATFALGLLEEDRGNLKVAEDLYRAALVIAKDNAPSDEVNRIRVALGRILQRERTPAGQAVPNSRLEERKSGARGEESVASNQEPGENEDRFVSEESNGCEEKECQPNFHPITGLLAAVIVQQVQFDDDEDPAVAKRIKESLEIAEELIASDNPKIKGQGYLLKGVALAKKGRTTEGLRVYVDGLKLVYPGKETKELVKMIEEHPIFQQPDIATRPDKGLADYHYAKGREFYFSRKYPEAEAHFKQAVTYTADYAPYMYFLGLSQIQQNTRLKRSAADYIFIKAGKLEAKGGANSFQQVNIHLDRIQGELREHLDRYRMGGINTVN
jgi:tetratricopeptide (TPR) repeat protein